MSSLISTQWHRKMRRRARIRLLRRWYDDKMDTWRRAMRAWVKAVATYKKERAAQAFLLARGALGGVKEVLSLHETAPSVRAEHSFLSRVP